MGGLGDGDMIPWLATQFQESRFGKLSSTTRVVRIACHLDYVNVSWLELGSWIGY